MNKKNNETEIKIRQIEEGIEELSIIISDIKSAGQSYLKLNPKAEYCPLCNTHFTVEALVKAIQKTQDSFTNSIALISLKEELEFISKRIDEIDKYHELTNKLKRLAFSIFSSAGPEKTIIEIQAACEENLKKVSSLSESLIQLDTIQSQFNNSGITEDRFIVLLNNINEYFSCNIKSNAELDLQRQKLIDKQAILSTANNQLEKELNEKELQLRNNFTAEITDEEQLLRRLNILQEIENNFKQLEIYLDFPANTYLMTILEKTDSVASVFETYKRHLLNQNNIVKQST